MIKDDNSEDLIYFKTMMKHIKERYIIKIHIEKVNSITIKNKMFTLCKV